MEEKSFSQGVRPGGLSLGYEIAVLICYIMDKSQQPMRFDQLHEAVGRDELVNYFALTQALDKLTDTGQVLKQTQEESMVYVLTERGAEIARTVYDTLPAAVRDRAAHAARMALLRQRREREIVTEIIKTGDGYNLTIRMTDIGSDLLSVSMFMPTKEDCEEIQKRFRNDPAFMYQSILALMMGEDNTAIKPTPTEDKPYV